MKRHTATLLLVFLLLGGSLYMHFRSSASATPCAQVQEYKQKISEVQARYPSLSEKVTDANRAALSAALSEEISAYKTITPPALARTQYLLALDTFRDFQAILVGGNGDGDFDADFAGDKRAQAALFSLCP